MGNHKYIPNYNFQLPYIHQCKQIVGIFKNMKLILLQISDTHIRKLFYLDPLQKY